MITKVCQFLHKFNLNFFFFNSMFLHLSKSFMFFKVFKLSRACHWNSYVSHCYTTEKYPWQWRKAAMNEDVWILLKTRDGDVPFLCYFTGGHQFCNSFVRKNYISVAESKNSQSRKRYQEKLRTCTTKRITNQVFILSFYGLGFTSSHPIWLLLTFFARHPVNYIPQAEV